MKNKIRRIQWEEVDRGVDFLVEQLKDNLSEVKNIYGLPRGGLIPAVMLSHRLDLPLIIDRRSVSKRTLVVDEIIDSGETMLQLSKRKKAKLCVGLYVRQGSKFTPDYAAFQITNSDWLEFPWEVKKSNT